MRAAGAQVGVLVLAELSLELPPDEMRFHPAQAGRFPSHEHAAALLCSRAWVRRFPSFPSALQPPERRYYAQDSGNGNWPLKANGLVRGNASTPHLTTPRAPPGQTYAACHCLSGKKPLSGGKPLPSPSIWTGRLC